MLDDGDGCIRYMQHLLPHPMMWSPPSGPIFLMQYAVLPHTTPAGAASFIMRHNVIMLLPPRHVAMHRRALLGCAPWAFIIAPCLRVKNGPHHHASQCLHRSAAYGMIVLHKHAAANTLRAGSYGRSGSHFVPVCPVHAAAQRPAPSLIPKHSLVHADPAHGPCHCRLHALPHVLPAG
jgi:hypothetical protein